jgi:hypothetical protein
MDFFMNRSMRDNQIEINWQSTAVFPYTDDLREILDDPEAFRNLKLMIKEFEEELEAEIEEWVREELALKKRIRDIATEAKKEESKEKLDLGLSAYVKKNSFPEEISDDKLKKAIQDLYENSGNQRLLVVAKDDEDAKKIIKSMMDAVPVGFVNIQQEMIANNFLQPQSDHPNFDVTLGQPMPPDCEEMKVFQQCTCGHKPVVRFAIYGNFTSTSPKFDIAEVCVFCKECDASRATVHREFIAKSASIDETEDIKLKLMDKALNGWNCYCLGPNYRVPDYADYLMDK